MPPSLQGFLLGGTHATPSKYHPGHTQPGVCSCLFCDQPQTLGFTTHALQSAQRTPTIPSSTPPLPPPLSPLVTPIFLLWEFKPYLRPSHVTPHSPDISRLLGVGLQFHLTPPLTFIPPWKPVPLRSAELSACNDSVQNSCLRHE